MAAACMVDAVSRVCLRGAFRRGLRGSADCARESGYRNWRGSDWLIASAHWCGRRRSGADYGYRPRRLYAYAPSYNIATTLPLSDYALVMMFTMNTVPFYCARLERHLQQFLLQLCARRQPRHRYRPGRYRCRSGLGLR